MTDKMIEVVMAGRGVLMERGHVAWDAAVSATRLHYENAARHEGD